ncbi:MAG TPA: AraC family transcriptional regulator [Candidatus Acidoferrum sp.]|nr:AraC family transcriptional regulator [Candidatus Acidoferrum sp.]
MSLISAHDQTAPPTAGYAPIVAQQQAALTLAAHSGGRQQDLRERGRLAATVIKLLEDADDVIGRDRDAARACIARASALLRDDIRPAHAPAALVQGGLAPWQIARVKAHVEAHLDATLRMRDLAAIARLSTGHFCRSFTRSLGTAPFAYVAARRLARAQELMLTTDEALSQIALACGLCDQSHLTRLFRRHLGTSPNAWRRSHRGDPAASAPPLPTPNPAPRYQLSAAKPAPSLQMGAWVQP